MRTAINLYSVRELDEPTLEVLDRVAAAGYDGVQFSGGFGDASLSAVTEKLSERDLDVAPAHVAFWELVEEDPTAIIDTYGRGLGCDGLVAPSGANDWFESRDGVDAGAEVLTEVVDLLAEHDLDLHYHNHDFEFTPLGETTAYDLLAEAVPNLQLEVDVGWAETAGRDPVELLERYADRITVVHMKDMTADGDFAEIGEGVVDMEACADAAAAGSTEWLVYEHDEPADPAASIETGAAFLNSL